MAQRFLSREGLQKLQNELQELKSKRVETSRIIETARHHGDLRENAEFHAAKEDQGRLETRIAQLESTIAEARILDEEDIDSDKILLGCTVVLKDLKKGRQVTYSIVDPEEMDIAQGKISVASPIAKGLLGHKVGEKVKVSIPAGDLEYQVEEISR
ncbi:MAG: transcription elongation factor GreA [Candidatus Omnitrophica bacterium]|nr:transcription elongation factor GreA [Candidatus Omnitrophota bacterium]